MYIFIHIYVYICVYIYVYMSYSCTDNHTVINIYILERHIYNISIYACHPFTYSYSFIFNFELNNFNSYNLLLYLGTFVHT